MVQKLMNHPITQPAHQNFPIATSHGIGHLMILAILNISMGVRTKNKFTKQKAQHLKATTLRTPMIKNGK